MTVSADVTTNDLAGEVLDIAVIHKVSIPKIDLVRLGKLAVLDVGDGEEANLIVGEQESREILLFRPISSINTADFCYFHQDHTYSPEIWRNPAL